jgi:cytochrome c-type biogenesis protein CcmH/NrfF
LSDSVAAGKVRVITVMASALGIDPTKEHLTAALLVVPVALLVSALFFFWGARKHSS